MLTTRRTLALTMAAASVVLGPSPPALAAPLPGMVQIPASSVTDSADFKRATATCVRDKVLVGAGFDVFGSTGEVVVDDFVPNGDRDTAPTSVTVGAYEADPFEGTWRVVAYALCADPLPGVVRIDSTNESNNSDDSMGVSAFCPAGKVLTGTGFELNGAQGEVIVETLRPNGISVDGPTAVDVGAFEADPPFAATWSVTAYAICADRLPGHRLEVPFQTSPRTSDDARVAQPRCPIGGFVTGAGFEQSGARGEVTTVALAPNGSPSGPGHLVDVNAFEEDPFAGTWSLRGNAICAVPR